MKWHRLGSKRLFSHPRIEIYEDTVLLPSGLRTDYLHFGEGTHASMVIAVNDKGNVLVQKEYSYPPNEILYQLPGGAIEKNESPLEGAVRELAEEAGIAGDLTPIGWFYSNNRRSSQKMYVFEARNLRNVTAKKDAEEMFEDHWLSDSEIENLIATNEIRNYTLLAGWAQYKAARR